MGIMSHSEVILVAIIFAAGAKLLFLHINKMAKFYPDPINSLGQHLCL